MSSRKRSWIFYSLALITVIVAMTWGRWISPFLNRARNGAHISCDMNMKQIWQGLHLYAADYGGQYSDRLTTLITYEDLTPSVFVCPSAGEDAASGKTVAEQIDAIDRSAAGKGLKDGRPTQTSYCSYIYIGQGLAEPVPENQVILYEPLSNHDGDGTYVLFGDGRVEWIQKNDPVLTNLPTSLPSRLSATQP